MANKKRKKMRRYIISIEKIVILFNGIFLGVAAAVLFIHDGLIHAEMYIFWFSLAAAILCSIMRMIIPREKPTEVKFDFEKEVKCK